MAEATTDFSTLDSHLCAVATELFEGVGYAPCFLRPAMLPRTVGEGVSAVIGFTGRGARGSISLLGAPQVAVVLRGEADRASPTDVLGEFCNMLMGRFKSRLLRRGVELFGTLPAVTTGEHVKLEATSSAPSSWHEIRIPSGTLYVRLDAILDESFAIAPVESANDGTGVLEGECLLF